MAMIHTLRGLLILLATVTLISLLALGGMAILAARSGADRLNEVNARAVAPLIQLQSVERRVKEIRFRIAGVALGQLPTVGSANHLKEAQAALPREWAGFRSMTATEALPDEEKKRLDKIDQGMKGLDALMGRLLTAYQNDDMTAVKSILEDDWPVVHGGVIKPLEQFMPYYQGVVNTAFEAATRSAARMTWMVGALFGLVIILVGVTIWAMHRRLGRQLAAARTAVDAVAGFDLTRAIDLSGRDEISDLLKSLSAMQDHLREVVRQVRDGVISLEQMSAELAEASAEVAGASGKQAETASGMAASMEQLSVSIDQMNEHATVSHDLAERSGEASREGREVTLEAAKEMAAIAEGARQSSGIVAELGGLSAEITSIVNVIKDIADQTNLLALNAAIEAARAGEQGRGFAVVADEVRKLAERTSSSTRQIGDMIQRIQSGTQRTTDAMQADVSRANQGEELARRAAESITQIERRADEVVRSVNEIHLSLREQSAAARDVAVRVEQIAQMTETNASASRQTSQNAGQVSSLAERLNGLVAGFRL
jgi:methyl-accepting chemotaxis protein